MSFSFQDKHLIQLPIRAWLESPKPLPQAWFFLSSETPAQSAGEQVWKELLWNNALGGIVLIKNVSEVAENGLFGYIVDGLLIADDFPVMYFAESE